MEIIRLLLFLIVLSSGILFLVRKLSFSQFLAPFVTIAGITIILYVCALLNFLKPGLIITVILLLIMGVFSFLEWPIKTQPQNKKINPPLVIWVFIFLVIAVYTTDTLFCVWDEFTHWGVIYKFLSVTDRLPDVSRNFLVTNYPPFTALFQYFAGNLLGKTESSAYLAHILLSFSAIIAILPCSRWKDWKKYAAALVLSILSVFPFDIRFQFLYVDLLLGLLFAAGLASAVFNDNLARDRVITIIFASVALTLTKPLGIVFAVVCIAILFVDVFMKNSQISSVKTFISSLLKTIVRPQILLVFGLTMLASLSWSIHTRQFNNTQINLSFNGIPIPSSEIYPADLPTYHFNLMKEEVIHDKNTYVLNQPNTIDISLVNILRIFTVNSTYRTKLITQGFLQSFSQSTFFTVKFTCLNALLLILFVSFVIGITNQEKIKTNNNLFRNNSILLIGFVIYAFAILFAYIYYFPPTAGIRIPELGRYLSSYLLGWWLLIVCLIYQQHSIKIPLINVQSSNIVIFTLLFTFILIIPVSAYMHVPNSAIPERFEVNRIYKAVASKITDDDKVYDIWQVDQTEGLSHYIMKYYLTPRPSNNYGWRLSTKESDVYREGNEFTTELSAEEWLNLLIDQKFTLVLVNTSDQVFWEEYGELFDKYNDNNVPQLFSVTPTGLTNIPIEVKY